MIHKEAIKTMDPNSNYIKHNRCEGELILLGKQTEHKWPADYFECINCDTVVIIKQGKRVNLTMTLESLLFYNNYNVKDGIVTYADSAA